MRILPLYYLEHLTDEEIAEHECSDRIWLSQSEFERWLTNAEPGIVTLIRLNNGLEQSAIGYPYAVHTNNTDPNTVYIPSWMYSRLDLDDMVQMEQFQPSLCAGLTLQPHTSDHLTLPDPETALRDAFERYACLTPGMEIPLWIGHSFQVTITELKPNTNTPLCIRNCELDLDLLPPLDTPAQDVFRPEENEQLEPMPNSLSPTIPDSVLESTTESGNILGGTVSQKSRRELLAEAALRRMNEKN